MLRCVTRFDKCACSGSADLANFLVLVILRFKLKSFKELSESESKMNTERL